MIKNDTAISFNVGITPLILELMRQDGLKDKIDEMIPKVSHNVKASCGELVQAMIACYLDPESTGGLSAIQGWVGRFPTSIFTEKQDPDENFHFACNRYSCSRTLDKIEEYDCGSFLLNIISTSKFIDKNEVRVANLDSTSIHYPGAPQENVEEDTNQEQKTNGGPIVPQGQACVLTKSKLAQAMLSQPINIKHGYSRDSHAELPQINILALSSRVPSIGLPIPIYQTAFSGNINDLKRFQEFFSGHELPTLKSFYPNLSVVIADSAAASVSTIKACKDNGINLLTRLRDSSVKSHFNDAINGNLSFDSIDVKTESGKNYKVQYAWIGQSMLSDKKKEQVRVHKILFVAEAMRDLKTASIYRKAETEKRNLETRLENLSRKPRACHTDAMNDFNSIVKDTKFCTISEPIVEELLGFNTPGRPSENAEKVLKGVKIKATVSLNDDVIKQAIEKELMYVVATTDTGILQTRENALNIYNDYHSQSDIEGVWKQMKECSVMIDSLFLKSEARIRALFTIIAIAMFYLRKLLSIVREVVQEHNLTLSFGSDPKCTKPSWSKFVKYVENSIQPTFTLYKGIVIPNIKKDEDEHNETNLIFLIARKIGGKAEYLYTDKYYEDNYDFNVSCKQEWNAEIRKSLSCLS